MYENVTDGITQSIFINDSLFAEDASPLSNWLVKFNDF